MSTYADTSFLVSLYVLDDNSAKASASFQRISLPLLLTPLLEIEIANALYLRVFRKEASERDIRTSLELFGKDVRAGIFQPRSLSSEIFRRASEIASRRTTKFGTRTLDLLHIASAIAMGADALWTFDRKQAELARSEGLTVRGL